MNDSHYSTASSWIAGASPGNETPGLPNGVANTNWISSMRQFSNSAVLRDTIKLNDCTAVVYNGTTYTTSIILSDTLRSTGGCDSVYHFVDIKKAGANPLAGGK